MISIEGCDNFTKIKSENYVVNKSIDNSLMKKHWLKNRNIKFKNIILKIVSSEVKGQSPPLINLITLSLSNPWFIIFKNDKKTLSKDSYPGIYFYQ